MICKSIYERYVPAIDSPINDKSIALWFAFKQNKLLVKLEGEKANIPQMVRPEDIGISPVRTQYLGTLEGIHCYSAEVQEDAPQAEAMEYRELRSLYGLLEEDLFLLAGKASQIVAWDQTNQYCGRCGTVTEPIPGERARRCPKCGLTRYPQICPAIIVAVIKDSKILLAHARNFMPGLYSVIAGFVETGETFEECVQRELVEEVGIKVKNLKYFKSQPWPFPNSLMIAFTAEYAGGDIQVDGVEIEDAGWYGVDELPTLPTSYSVARQLIDWFINTYAK